MQDHTPCAQFIKSLETHVHSLLRTRPEYLLELTFMATLASQCCRLTNHSNSSVPDPCSILKALLQVQFNSIAIVPQQHAAAADRVAVAVYPTASLMNHSCIPNVALTFEGASLTARVTETVQPGTPVLHCYGTFFDGVTCPGCPCLAPTTSVTLLEHIPSAVLGLGPQYQAVGMLLAIIQHSKLLIQEGMCSQTIR